MRRTTSLSELSPAGTQQPIFPTRANASRMEANPPVQERKRVKRRHSTDLSWVDASHFLNCCGLCKRAIGPGCDTFMYRGEVAFCSQECRERQIVEELRKMRKKRSLSSMKKPNLPPPLRRSGAAVKADSVAACYWLGR
ncbi:hypothetical protein KSP39_PZI003690 [Platanthera zijinensis]|uniref:FLZ-type domain-containing protein n=1 Tax=Platanthera zijinensis TaxID=2320716 RepID=A0AAP0BWK7_9ASPA